MRRWSHQQEVVTARNAYLRLQSSLPVKIILFRHMEQEGFKTLSIKELRAELGISGAVYITELTDGSGKILDGGPWTDLESAVDAYNKI